MFDLFDKVIHKPTGKTCFIIDIDESVDETEDIKGIIYGLEAENQDDEDWFYWSEEKDLARIAE